MAEIEEEMRREEARRRSEVDDRARTAPDVADPASAAETARLAAYLESAREASEAAAVATIDAAAPASGRTTDAAVVIGGLATADFARAAERERIRRAAGLDQPRYKGAIDSTAGDLSFDGADRSADAMRRLVDERRAEVDATDRASDVGATFDAWTGQPVDAQAREAQARDQRVVDQADAFGADALQQFTRSADGRRATQLEETQRQEREQIRSEGDVRFGGADPRYAFVVDARDPNRPGSDRSGAPGGDDPTIVNEYGERPEVARQRESFDDAQQEYADQELAKSARTMSVTTLGIDDGAASDQAMGEGEITAVGPKAPDDPYARYRGAVDKARQGLGEAGEYDRGAELALRYGQDPHVVLERGLAPGPTDA